MPQKRKLGLIEESYRYMHDAQHGYSLISTMIQVSGSLNPEIFVDALQLMQQKHPVLRAYLGESTRKHDYLVVDDEPRGLPLKVIDRIHDEQWMDLFEQNMVEPFSRDGSYLWRATLLYGGEGESAFHEIVMGVHHSIFDGISAGSFFGQLLDYYRLLADGEEPDTSILCLPPSFEHLLGKKSSWPGFVMNLGLFSIYTITSQLKHLIKYEEYAPYHQRRAKNLFYELNSQQLDKLKGLCRENDVTLTSLLTAALILSCSANHSGNGRSRNGKFGQITGTPVSLREYCEPKVEKEQLGCFIGSYPTGHLFDSSTSIWEIASSYREQLDTFFNKRNKFPPPKYSKSIWDKMITFSDYGPMKKRFHFGVGVTNIGRLDYPPQFGPLRPKRFHFCAAQHGGGLLMLMHTASIGDRMLMNFSYEEPLVSHEKAKSIADECVSILESLPG